MFRRFGTFCLTLCLLLSVAAGAGVSVPTIHLICRMTGTEVTPATSHATSDASCCAIKERIAGGVTVSASLEVPGCCDIKASPGHPKAFSTAPASAPDLAIAWLPAPVPHFFVPTLEAVRTFPVADLTGPRPPPASSPHARGPPSIVSYC